MKRNNLPLIFMNHAVNTSELTEKLQQFQSQEIFPEATCILLILQGKQDTKLNNNANFSPADKRWQYVCVVQFSKQVIRRFFSAFSKTKSHHLRFPIRRQLLQQLFLPPFICLKEKNNMASKWRPLPPVVEAKQKKTQKSRALSVTGLSLHLFEKRTSIYLSQGPRNVRK